MDSFSLQPLTTQILTHKKQNKTEESSPDEPEFLFHFDIEDDESNNKVTTSQTLFIRRNKSQRRRDRRKRKSKPLLNVKGDVSETNHTEVIAELNDNNPKNFHDVTTTDDTQDVIENCSIHLNHSTIEQSANQTMKPTLMEQESRQQQHETNESISIIEHNVSDPVTIDAVRITQKESNQQHSINDVRSRAAKVIRQKIQNKPGKSQKQKKTLKKKKKSGEMPPSPLVRFDVQNTTKLYGITNRQAFAARWAAKTGPIGRPKEKGQIEEEEQSSTNAFAFGFDINIP